MIWTEIPAREDGNCPVCGADCESAEGVDIQDPFAIQECICENGPMSATASNGLLRVSLDWEGEGLCGEYDPGDPGDVPLLRFVVDIKNDEGEWEELEDASYCTCVSANAPLRVQEEIAQHILSEYADVVDAYPPAVSVKKLGERLSWLSDKED